MIGCIYMLGNILIYINVSVRKINFNNVSAYTYDM